MKEFLRRCSEYFEPELAAVLDGCGAPEPLLSAMKYAALGGGKRLRPALCFLGAEFAGGRAEDVVSFAVAIESIHCYSLVHDDLPAMDDDTLRRGKPTVHVAYGEGMAVLCGDALLNLAYETLFAAANTPERVTAAGIIAKCAGVKGMVGGQCLDLGSDARDADGLLRVYYGKTSALLKAALTSGAAACGASAAELDDLAAYAENLGAAFQIKDDILDVTSTTEVLGKDINSDTDNGKVTFVTLFGVDGAEAEAERYGRAALSAISGYGDRSAKLTALCEYLAGRKY